MCLCVDTCRDRGYDDDQGDRKDARVPRDPRDPRDLRDLREDAGKCDSYFYFASSVTFKVTSVTWRLGLVEAWSRGGMVSWRLGLVEAWSLGGLASWMHGLLVPNAHANSSV